MVHHIAPDEVGAAIEGLIAKAESAPSATSRTDAELEGAPF